MTRAELEARVLESIDDAQMTRDLEELVVIASVDGTQAEAVAQHWCAERLQALGMAVDVWESPIAELSQHREFPGMEVERSSVIGCVGRLGDSPDLPAVAFYGHTDVVPPGDLAAWPEGDPFRLRITGGTAWGRGACDMKAGLVAAIGAVQAIRASAITLRRPLAVHCVSAEEDGGVGAFATLRRGHRAAACVSAEPTGGTIVPANAGALTFRLEVPGLATHGSTRLRGVSAIERFESVHAALRQLEHERNVDVPELFAHLDLAWPLSVGIVSAGDWASTVPDLLVAEGRYGVRVDETVEAAIDAFERCVRRASDHDAWLDSHPVRVSWPGGTFGPGALAGDHPLLAQVSAAVADVRGAPPEIRGAPYGSDLRHYISAGIPTLQYGPGHVRHAHASDEHVELEDLAACARVYALLALRRCRNTEVP